MASSCFCRRRFDPSSLRFQFARRTRRRLQTVPSPVHERRLLPGETVRVARRMEKFCNALASISVNFSWSRSTATIREVAALYADFVREADGPLRLRPRGGRGRPRRGDRRGAAGGPGAPERCPPAGPRRRRAGRARRRPLPRHRVAEVKSMYVAPGLPRHRARPPHPRPARRDRPRTRLPRGPARHLRLPHPRRRPLPRRRLPRGPRLQREPESRPLVRTRPAPGRLSCSGPSAAARAPGRSGRRGRGSRSGGGSRGRAALPVSPTAPTRSPSHTRSPLWTGAGRGMWA